MNRALLVFSILGLVFLLLSIFVTSQVIYSKGRIKQTAREIEQQYNLMKSEEVSVELLKKLEISNRNIEKGLVMLSSHEVKLQYSVLLLIACGIISISIGGVYMWRKQMKR